MPVRWKKSQHTPGAFLRIAAAGLVLAFSLRAAAQEPAPVSASPTTQVVDDSEDSITVTIDELARAGRTRDALAEADRFIARGNAGAAMRAQRGFVRRELNDLAGAADDFAEALAGEGLTDEQERNVRAGLAEARAERGFLRRATNDTHGAAEDFAAALSGEGLTAEQRRNVEAALTEMQKAERQSAEAKAAERKAADEAQRRLGEQARTAHASTQKPDIEALIAAGNAPGWAYVERGLARRKVGNLQGALHDFDAALAGRDLTRQALADVRYARAEAAAALAERQGKPLMAEATYRELLQSEPKQADAWYKLGYLLLKRKQRGSGADALTHGLEIKPVATAYLDAASAYVLSNAPLASKQYHRGLDRWYAGDTSIRGRPATDLERIRNEVVQADASIQTSASLGGMVGRPASAGGGNNAGGAETRVRFDGRYLPAVAGLEAFARGLSDKDANGERETDAGAGLRYRPIPDLNFYVGGLLDHFFQPKSETEFVAAWGLGLGADAYPYAAGWKPYWDFGTFGSWRTRDARVLEDVHGNAGFLYELRGPLRAAAGPTLLAVAGYDSKAGTRWAAGVGPSLMSYIWLGGDKYRSYDAVVTLQVGYIFSIGPDQRQRGWRGQISVTF